MERKLGPTWLTDEIADFLAACPSQKELLAYRPSAMVQDRFNVLLGKSKAGALSTEEEWELNQFEHAEMLMQSIKARLRPRRRVAT